MEFHVIELPKLPPLSIKDEDNVILLWAKFISAERKEDFDMLAGKDPYIESAYHKLQIISQDKQKRMEYEARQKAILDHNQFLKEAEERGEERGEKKGIIIGEKRGIERFCKLQKLLLQDARYDDLALSSSDDQFREKLFKEFNI